MAWNGEYSVSHLSESCICIFRIVPGGRDVFANVIRVSTPNNFEACQTALAAGMGLFHGMLLRRKTSGQLPVVIVYLF